MANRHFAKLGDVWKHLPLCEILALEQPRLYWESHAGSASYEMIEDAERIFGAQGFWNRAQGSDVLAQSQYMKQMVRFNQDGQLRMYPGSSLLAMAELGDTAGYLLCDTDPHSAESLQVWADTLGVGEHVKVVCGDGLNPLHDALQACDPARLLVHIDPFDPWSKGTAGPSALELAGEVAESGARLVYWYGYDRADWRAWALKEIAELTSARLWCGDVVVASTRSDLVESDGDLGLATTPGTGFGIVCAHLADRALHQCEVLGRALADAWSGVPLPHGGEAILDFCVRTRP